MYLWLLPSVEILTEGDSVWLIAADGKGVAIAPGGTQIAALLRSLDGQITSDRVQRLPIFKALRRILKVNGWLATLDQPLSVLRNEYPALTREISYFAHAYPHRFDSHFRRAANKRVLIIGAGGIGTQVAFSLCASGVSRITVVDPDVVEESNLNRQFLYDLGDLRKPKVQALAAALRRRFDHVEVKAIRADFDQDGLARTLVVKSDITVVCGESQVLYEQPAICADAPVLFCGYEGITGVVGPLVSRSEGTACWACLMRVHARAAARTIGNRRTSNPNPSGANLNAVVGAFAAEVTIRFLSGQRSRSFDVGAQYRFRFPGCSMRRTLVHPKTCIHSLKKARPCFPD